MRVELNDTNPAKEQILEQAQGHKRVVLAGEDILKRADITDIVKALSNEEIIVETDGQEFAAAAEALKEAGLTGVIFDVNTMRHTRYKNSHDGKDLNQVVESINKAVEQQLKVRLHVSLEKGFSDDEILDFVQLTFQHDYEIIFMPTMPYEEIKEKIKVRPVEGDFGDVDMFKYAAARGKIGFLKKVS